jgi:Holliday junction resolvasome RuvABC endonuclease subunit
MSYPISVMGLDGSLANFGIAVATVNLHTKTIIEVKDLILSKTTKNPKLKRADDDFARFRQHWLVIKKTALANNVNIMFGEIPSGAQDARASFAFGGITATLAGLSIDYDVTTVTPTEVKVAATGFKHADKEDVIQAMYRLYSSAPWITGKKPNGMGITTASGLYLTNANEHLADATAVIVAGLKK